MPRRVILALVIMAILSLSACMPIAAPDGAPAEAAVEPGTGAIKSARDVPRISVDEAKAHFDDGSAAFVDSRSRSSYDSEHIVGALPAPEGSAELDSSIPKDQLIITYCT